MALSRVAIRGVPGLRDLELELGDVTALVGPRGSGKSRLLAAVSWLLSGAPALAEPDHPQVDPVRVEGRLAGTRIFRIVREGPGAGALQPATAERRLPMVSFLQARDRLLAGGTSGPFGRRLRARLPAEAGDAAAAEALLATVEECCRDGVRGEMLLIEEPELMLTPQAQRYLFRLLHDFAVDNQVIYSTRSPALLDAAHHEEIVRLDLTVSGTVVRRTDPEALSEAQRVRLAAEFDHERGEMFFARAVVLVEGQTERLALPAIFRTLGYDADALGIAITEVGGKANLAPAARLLNQLHIPFVIVFDSDRGAPGAQLNDAIYAVAEGAPVIALDPDFEAVAGIASHDDKVLHAWQRFAAADRSAVPRPLTEVVLQAVALLP